MKLMARTYRDDQKWVVEKIQPLAISQIYDKVWPQCTILEMDDDEANRLKKLLDIGGADKILQFPDGTVSFLAQRFRTYAYSKKYDDFTLRFSRPLSGYTTECEKVLTAFEESRMVAAYYGYGHVNKEETGFLRFRIVDFKAFIKRWMKSEIPAPHLILNKDRSASFLSWSFHRLPKSIILFEFVENEKGLEDFM